MRKIGWIVLLVTCLRAETTAARDKDEDVAPQDVLALIKSLHDKDEAVRFESAEALRMIDSEIEQVISALIKIIMNPNESEEVHDIAMITYRKICNRTDDEVIVRAYICLLDSREEWLRSFAIDWLGSLGPAAKDSVLPILIERFKDQKYPSRKKLAKAIGKIGSKIPRAVTVLTNIIEDRDDDAEVRETAATVLIQCGVAMKNDVVYRILFRFLDESEEGVRVYIFEELGNLGTAAKRAVPKLIDALENPGEMECALEALSKIGPPVFSVLTIVLNHSSDADGDLPKRKHPKLGVDPENIVPSLVGFLNEGKPNLKRLAAIALGILGPDAKEATPALFEVFENSSGILRVEAAVALANIGQEARCVVPWLIEASKEQDKLCRRKANKFLEAFSTSDSRVRRRIKEARGLLEEDEFAFALKILQDVLDEPGHSPIRKGNHWSTTREEVESLLLSRGSEVLEIYRGQNESHAQAFLEKTENSCDYEAMEEVVRRFFLTQAGFDAANRLASYHLDRGNTSMAMYYLKQILDCPCHADRITEAVHSKYAVALAMEGKIEEARAAIQPLSTDQHETLSLVGNELERLAARSRLSETDEQESPRHATGGPNLHQELATTADQTVK